MSDLARLSLAELAAGLRAGSHQVADIVTAATENVNRFNNDYHAYSHQAAPEPDTLARLQAELAAGNDRGPLHGMTASVKGSIPVAGLPYTEGSAIYAERIADHDAAIVARLRQAGSVIVGLTTLSELAMYGTTNPFEPMGLNPWDPDRTAGGSSTGAAVAAALAMGQIHVGTDSGGSLRNPACHCGAVGLMPRMGRLSGAGAVSRTPTLSSVGLIGRSIADVTSAFAVLSEPAPEGDYRNSPDLQRPPRLLIPRRIIETMCDEETLALFSAAAVALRTAGASLQDCEVEGWLEAEEAAGIVSLYEGAQSLSPTDLSGASDGIRRRAELARALTDSQVAAARATGSRFGAAMRQALRGADADAFASPTWPFPAPPITAETMPVQGREVPVDPHRNCFVRVANACDACAISLPMGLYSSCAVPAGFHLMRGDNERQLLAAATFAENALPALPPAPPLQKHFGIAAVPPAGLGQSS